MSTRSSKWCRICLTNNKDDNISEAEHYKEIFIQLVSIKYCEKLQLCMWCKTVLKKTIILQNLALASEKLLRAENEMLPGINTDPSNRVLKLSQTNVAHFNISPDIKNGEMNINTDGDLKENKSPKKENINIIYLKNIGLCFEKELNLNEVLIEGTSNPIDLFEEVEYKNEIVLLNNKNIIAPKTTGCILSDNSEKEKENIKKTIQNKNNLKTSLDKILKKNNKERKNVKLKKNRRIDLKLDEFEFEVRYLNLEEQKKEMKSKKIKYKDMKFQCDLCGVGFLTNDYFESHKLRHTKAAGQNKCSICSLHFKSPLVLSQHVLSHKRLFSCLICGSQFSKWSNCVGHRQKCGARVLYVECEICSKLFSDEYSLKTHRRVHDLKQQFSCSHCGHKFNTKQRLIVHLRSHTGDKPFSCTVCSRSFSTNSNLRAHGVVHREPAGGEHYCVECNTRYKTHKSLRRHLAESPRHVREQSHMLKCKECYKLFSSARSLQSHLARHTSRLAEAKCQHCAKEQQNRINSYSSECQNDPRPHSIGPCDGRESFFFEEEESAKDNTSIPSYKIFSNKSNLTKHLKSIHKKVLLPSEERPPDESSQ